MVLLPPASSSRQLPAAAHQRLRDVPEASDEILPCMDLLLQHCTTSFNPSILVLFCLVFHRFSRNTLSKHTDLSSDLSLCLHCTPTTGRSCSGQILILLFLSQLSFFLLCLCEQKHLPAKQKTYKQLLTNPLKPTLTGYWLPGSHSNEGKVVERLLEDFSDSFVR